MRHPICPKQVLPFLIAASLFSGGCGGDSADGNGALQLNCTVTSGASGAVITCPDGSSTTIANGAAGATGAQGNGTGILATPIPAGDARCLQGNGGFVYTTFVDPTNTGVFEASDTVESVSYLCNGATGAQGLAGATGATGSQGETGSQGNTGAQGVAGAAGTSSSISLAAANDLTCATGGWVITVTNGSLAPLSYPLCNGATGAAGAQGAAGQAAPTSPLSLVQLIAPCGLASSAWKEELLLFSDGTLLADFSSSADGQDTRLSLIPDGTYEDTDESGCIFAIGTSGTTRTISWGAGSSVDDPSGWSAGGQSWTVSD